MDFRLLETEQQKERNVINYVRLDYTVGWKGGKFCVQLTGKAEEESKNHTETAQARGDCRRTEEKDIETHKDRLHSIVASWRKRRTREKNSSCMNK